MSDDTQPQASAYAQAGVDVDEAERAVQMIAPTVRATHGLEVFEALGFSGLYNLAAVKKMDNPVAVCGTDGVGTKIDLARQLGYHGSVGIDLVAMCVNDVIRAGARPMFFLDYGAYGKIRAEHIAVVVSGIAAGCRQAGCALIGGEMAEHPGVMKPEDYDLAGFCVGVVDRKNMVNSSRIQAGDKVLGLASSGVHSNGFSLVRRLLSTSDTGLWDVAPFQTEELESRIAHIKSKGDSSGYRTVGEVLLQPTRIYVSEVLGLLDHFGPEVIRGIAHITGGGLKKLLKLTDSSGLGFGITDPMPVWPELAWIQKLGKVSDLDMHVTFNMGMGMAIVVARGHEEEVRSWLNMSGPFPSKVVGEVTDQGHKVSHCLGFKVVSKEPRSIKLRKKVHDE